MNTKVVLCLVALSLVLTACAIPPRPIHWRTEPGKIQRINANPQSPYYHQL